MEEISHTHLFGADCLLVERSDSLRLYAKDENDYPIIYRHCIDAGFDISYRTLSGKKSDASIDYAKPCCGAVDLYPRYIFERYIDKPVSGFELTGEAVDDFFSPADYYYFKSNFEEGNQVDLVYGSELVRAWKIIFEGSSVGVALKYGGILSRGTSSDLMLHPKIEVSFEPSNSVDYVFRVYKILVRFLQIVRYRHSYGRLRVDLFSGTSDKKSFIGRLRECSSSRVPLAKVGHIAGFRLYLPHIEKVLQFAADNTEYDCRHYPENELRCFKEDYSLIDFTSIYTAFEAECNADRELYLKYEVDPYKSVRRKFLKYAKAFPSDGSDVVACFLKEVNNRVSGIGRNRGQRQSIMRAYGLLKSAVDSSLSALFHLGNCGEARTLSDDEIFQIADALTKLRGGVFHGTYSGALSDSDIDRIRFLEVLTYAQTLKRIGFDDSVIERIVGLVFDSNSIALNESLRFQEGMKPLLSEA
ncbi:hypothetical protein [Denitrobacterium detoxificans]|jgi:hypothetical protein|uniref:hypothetical protein n=1 Tax=Denitrobacterium detoxificans TaxID=79604 RepID=UPI0026EF44FF|nr:hypothetical protein [Denitrobacterium detoxificans]MBE6465989.1 hypothetical protein [Denitrobacterium detoxificans]